MNGATRIMICVAILCLVPTVYSFSLPAQETVSAQSCPNSAHSNTLSETSGDILRPLSADHFIDSTGSLSFEDVREHAFEINKCLAIYTAPRPGEALWLRFSVVNDSNKEKNWVLDFNETVFGKLTLFEHLENNTYRAVKNGRSVIAGERANGELRTSLPVNLNPQSRSAYYLKVEMTIAPSVSPRLTTQYLFQATSTAFTILSAVFSGFLIAILIVSLVIFRYVEIVYYQFYAAYVGSILVTSIFWDGWPYLLTDTTLSMADLFRLQEVTGAIAAISLTQFTRILLELKPCRSTLNRMLNICTGAIVLLAVFAVLDPWTFAWPLEASYAVVALLLFCVAIVRVRDGVPQAKALCFSFLVLFLGIGIANWFFFNPLEPQSATSVVDEIVRRPQDWGFHLAIIGESMFMAAAIATLVKTTNQQKFAATAAAVKLEHKVTTIQDAFEEQAERSKTRIADLEDSLIRSRPGAELSPADTRFVEWATEQVHNHLRDTGFGVQDLAEELGTSEKTLGRKLKNALGLTPAVFIRTLRLQRARDLMLIHQHNSVAEVAYAVGFSNTGHFAKLYREAFGESPKNTLKTTTNSG